MDEIKASVQINASTEKVWNIVSDLDGESRLWNNITKIRNLSQEGNTVKRELIMGKGDRCLQTVTVYPKEKIHAEFTKGIINGTKIITLIPSGSGTTLGISWNIKFTGAAGFMKGMLLKNFEQQTEAVLETIKRELEFGVQPSNVQMESRTHWADLIDSDKK